MRFAGYLSFRAKQESILAISIGVDDKGTQITSSSENKIFFAHSALGLVPGIGAGLVPGIRDWCQRDWCQAFVLTKTVVANWDRLTAYYDFPREHWKHLRTSNVVESPFSRVRLRTAASRRFKSQVNATCLIWKTLMVAEMSFRRLNAPELVAKVVDGTRYEDGEEIREDRDAA